MTDEAIQRNFPDLEGHREADQAHRERIHAEIADDILFVSEEVETGGKSTMAFVDAIAAGRIRHLTINY